MLNPDLDEVIARSHRMTTSPMPVCTFLSELPPKEIQSLKEELTAAWRSVEVESPFVKEFRFLSWDQDGLDPTLCSAKFTTM